MILSNLGPARFNKVFCEAHGFVSVRDEAPEHNDVFLNLRIQIPITSWHIMERDMRKNMFVGNVVGSLCHIGGFRYLPDGETIQARMREAVAKHPERILICKIARECALAQRSAVPEHPLLAASYLQEEAQIRPMVPSFVGSLRHAHTVLQEEEIYAPHMQKYGM